MSRLKGADLGVSIPAGTTAFRGVWNSVTNYALNEVVVRNGQLYVANIAGAGNDPAVPGPQTRASVANAGLAGNGTNIRCMVQVFTPTATMTVDAVSIGIASAGADAGWAGSPVVGIVAGALAVNADVSAVTFLAAAAVNSTNSPGLIQFDVPLGQTVTLTGGQQYTLVVMGPTVAENVGHLAVSGASPTVSGMTLGNQFFGSALVANNPGNATYPIWFALRKLAVQWAPLGGGVETVGFYPNIGSTLTLPDVGVATMHRVTLGANTTITLPPPAAGKSLTIELVQDATGGRTVAWATPSGAIRWAGGAAPVITAAANAIDVVTFICIGGTNWYGVPTQAFA